MVWCIDKLLPRSEHRFLPVDAHNWQRVVYFSQSSFAHALPSLLRFDARRRGRAHARTRGKN